jgi:hypothetical protein
LVYGLKAESAERFQPSAHHEKRTCHLPEGMPMARLENFCLQKFEGRNLIFYGTPMNKFTQVSQKKILTNDFFMWLNFKNIRCQMSEVRCVIFLPLKTLLS